VVKVRLADFSTESLGNLFCGITGNLAPRRLCTLQDP
jgi:hypothetical protein